jgi:hypothetical protein
MAFQQGAGFLEQIINFAGCQTHDGFSPYNSFHITDLTAKCAKDAMGIKILVPIQPLSFKEQNSKFILRAFVFSWLSSYFFV